MKNIDHVVVVMMENRSFDNLLGWVYDDQGNRPVFNIPPQDPPTCDGLKTNTFSNRDASGTTVYASRPPTTWPSAPVAMTVPTPDPHEEFDRIAYQLYGTETPLPGAVPDMSGFLRDYATTSAGAASAGQIMETYGPAEANVINQLARNFAISDRWFASLPAQTWPNRGFVHCGSSDGHINNDDYEPYDIPTIFNVLENRRIPWGVFADTTLLPSLTHGQFVQIWPLEDNIHPFALFEKKCRAGLDSTASDRLPSYSFVEPRFMPEPGLFEIDYPSDYHPPHDVARGDLFLSRVYEAVRSSPYRDRILLVVTFDEHGGCYDHVPPPSGAAPPHVGAVSRYGNFRFDRFGVRVPTIVISSYIQAGTVFRASPGEAPYDHTSILATLRDWQNLNDGFFLQNPRIVAVPTLDRVQTLEAPRLDWPDLSVCRAPNPGDASLNTPLNDIQKSLIAIAIRQKTGAASADASQQAKSLGTYQEAMGAMHPDLITAPTGAAGHNEEEVA